MTSLIPWEEKNKSLKIYNSEELWVFKLYFELFRYLKTSANPENDFPTSANARAIED